MVKSLDEVRRQLLRDEVELTKHAAENVVHRGISEREIREAGAESVAIEEYPDDKFSPSCLILGVYQGRQTTSYSGLAFRCQSDKGNHSLRTGPGGVD